MPKDNPERGKIMAQTNSAFSADKITVEDMVSDPTWISSFVGEWLDGTDIADALFREGGPNEGVVAFREAAAPFLNDEPENLAEFAEIPVSEMNTGKLRSIIGQRVALGIQISRDMVKRNQLHFVTNQLIALRNTMVKSGIDSSIAAFRSANVPTMNVTLDWENADAVPLKDLRVGKRMVANFRAPNAPDKKMGYKADTFLVSESNLELALWHESVQKLYRGNIASENPLYKDDDPSSVSGLRILSHPLLEDDEAYILQRGVAGFRSDEDPLTITDLYAPNGENGYGGSTQSWRADAFRKRIIALDNPGAVVRLVGVTQ